jgi:hypothetical protein
MRNRLRNTRHTESDTAVVQADHHAKHEGEVNKLKEELTDKVESWREKIKKACHILRKYQRCLDVVSTRSKSGAFTRLVDSFSR